MSTPWRLELEEGGWRTNIEAQAIPKGARPNRNDLGAGLSWDQLREQQNNRDQHRVCNCADGAERNLRAHVCLHPRDVGVCRGADVSAFPGNCQTQQCQEEMHNDATAGRLAADEFHNCKLDAGNGWALTQPPRESDCSMPTESAVPLRALLLLHLVRGHCSHRARGSRGCPDQWPVSGRQRDRPSAIAPTAPVGRRSVS